MIITLSYLKLSDAIGLWGLGTLYMCLFALFVGMTRQYILRPGTLFFIRSPDDPNIRLVHDALMKPLHLQLWRICQSALVYTLFILIGVGGVTHGLRAIDSPLLPIRINALTFALPTLLLCPLIVYNSSLLKKYVRQYWTRAFKACSAQLRLSSFILGKHDPKERGRIVYRNIFTMLKGAKPDYTQPKTALEAKQIFSTTDAGAVFIPDGYHVRAPKFDVASRSFIRKLFIPVTKEDIPLNGPVSEVKKNDYLYSEDSDEEDSQFDHYEIVYRPPHFGKRIVGLIVMLWVFAVILFAGVLLVSNLVGRPTAYLWEKFAESCGVENNDLSFLSVQLDAGSVIFGFLYMLIALKKYDEYLIKKHMNQTNENDEIVDVGDRHQIIAFATETIYFFANISIYVICSVAYLAWSGSIHFSFFKGLSLLPVLFSNGPGDLALHVLLAMVYTMRPVYHFLLVEYQNVIVNAWQFGLPLALQGAWGRLAVPLLWKYATSFLVIGILRSNIVLYEYLSNGSNYADLTDAIYRVGISNEAHSEAILLTTPIVVCLELLYKLYCRASVLYKGLNAEVKEEHYAKGKTLENVQSQQGKADAHATSAPSDDEAHQLIDDIES